MVVVMLMGFQSVSDDSRVQISWKALPKQLLTSTSVPRSISSLVERMLPKEIRLAGTRRLTLLKVFTFWLCGLATDAGDVGESGATMRAVGDRAQANALAGDRGEGEGERASDAALWVPRGLAIVGERGVPGTVAVVVFATDEDDLGEIRGNSGPNMLGFLCRFIGAGRFGAEALDLLPSAPSTFATFLLLKEEGGGEDRIWAISS
jgi:hypothetical protein